MSIENENELEFNEDEIQEEQPTEEPSPEESGESAEYTPNLSYKVKDEEFSFDERLHGVIKSKEDEEYFRELYTKSAGLDGYKSKYGELEEQASALIQGFQTLKTLRDNKDMRGLMKALNIEEDDILSYTEALLTEKELPEEQRQLIQKNRELEERLSGFESKLSSFEQQEANTRVQDDIRELESLVTSETYMPIAQAMKSVGLDIADEVITAGHMEYTRTGKEPSVASVVQAVAGKYGYLLNNQQSSQEKPVIPDVKGTGGTPVSKRPTSIEELRKMTAQVLK